jgi:hypothetical protein
VAAALSASGTLTSMKTAQVELSASVLTEARNHNIPGTHMKASDIITSEYGNGLLFDRAVNAGPAPPKHELDLLVREYLKQHPGADLTSEPARGAIERAFISWAEGQAPGRATNIAKATKHEPGSFAP